MMTDAELRAMALDVSGGTGRIDGVVLGRRVMNETMARMRAIARRDMDPRIGMIHIDRLLGEARLAEALRKRTSAGVIGGLEPGEQYAARVPTGSPFDMDALQQHRYQRIVKTVEVAPTRDPSLANYGRERLVQELAARECHHVAGQIAPAHEPVEVVGDVEYIR